MEQEDFLGYIGDLTTPGAPVFALQSLPVHLDFALFGAQQATEKIGEGAFAGARGADDGGGAACGQPQVVKGQGRGGAVGIVAEQQIAQADAVLQG